MSVSTKDSAYLSATTPIYPTSTFRWDDLETNGVLTTPAAETPTRQALEENIASLEGGTDCRATSTGMSAITATAYLFQSGDHIIAGKDIYGGTYRLFADILAHQHLEFTFVDMMDLDAIRAAVRPETRGIWIETPSNPLLHVTDMAAVCEIAGDAGAITIADNTFCSPYLQRPFEHGVDVVMHSTTKYLNGHSDVVGGCVVTRHQQHAERIAYITNALGLACSPFDAWLVLRGIKTLGPRMEAHQLAAQAVARDARITLPGESGLLSRPGQPSGPRTGGPSAGRIRSDVEFRSGGWSRDGRTCPDPDRFVPTGRVAGRSRVVDFLSRDDEPRVDGRTGSPGRGDHRWYAASQLRD